MKIVQARAWIENHTPDIEKTIEFAGRVCYKSEDKVTPESHIPFIKRLIDSHHESVLEHGSITVKVVCDRGVSHELVRHRIASFSQESTRYCNYGKGKFGEEITVIDLATGFAVDLAKENGAAIYTEWHAAMQDAERHYMNMTNLGASPQLARSVLPNSLKTEIIITANPREWRHIFSMRCAPSAHPQAREVMLPLLKDFKAGWPTLFTDLFPES